MNKVKKILLPALLATAVAGVTGAVVSMNAVKASATEQSKGDVQITLTDGIIVKYYTDVAGTVTFDNEVNALDVTVTGAQEGSSYVYKYELITPQYVDSKFSITLNQETTPIVSDYSVVTYCETITQGAYSAEEKAVAQDLIYYGQAAKAYKLGGSVTATQGTAYAGVKGELDLTGDYTNTDKIHSATVVFDSVPAIKFYFAKASETAEVTVDGTDVTKQLTQEKGLYVYTKTGIYATDFDKKYNVTFTNDGKTQTLNYSVNDYATRTAVSSNANVTAEMKTLAKALWSYGAGAEALLTAQKTYTIDKAPTYTETGIASNGVGEEVTLPILNASNYTYTQTATDGGAYAYNNNAGGIATFTHKVYPEIVVEKEITADTITFDYSDWNNVNVHWQNKISGTADYVDGSYVFTLDGDKTITNINCLNASALPNVKFTGNGSLTVLKNNTQLGDVVLDGVTFLKTTGTNAFNTLTISDGANVNMSAITMKNAADITIANATVTLPQITGTDMFTLQEGANVTMTSMLTVKTFNSQAGSMFTNTVPAGKSAIEFTVGAKFYGALNLTGGGNESGIKGTISSTENGKSFISDTTRIKMTNFAYGFAGWMQTATLYYPADVTKDATNKKFYKGEDVLVEMTDVGTFMFYKYSTATPLTYDKVTDPTFTTEGSAIDNIIGEQTLVLPKLNQEDYSFVTSENMTTFTHKVTGLTFDKISTAAETISIGGKAYNEITANLIADGLTAEYIDNAYVLTVAEGKSITVGAITSTGSLEIKGAGTLTVTAQMTVNNLKLHAGTNVIIEMSKKADALTHTGTAYLYGSLTIKVNDTYYETNALTQLNATAIAGAKGYQTAVYVDKSTRISIENFQNSFATWPGSDETNSPTKHTTYLPTGFTRDDTTKTVYYMDGETKVNVITATNATNHFFYKSGTATLPNA